MQNIFDPEIAESFITRIEKLTPATKPRWGKMNVAQMLAHCNVTYELVYEDKHPKPGFLKQTLLKWFVKDAVVSEKPYKKNLRTAPEFLVVDARDFDREKQRLIAFIRKTYALGADSFEGKVSHSFGPLTREEWNNMFTKHLEHHLTQFGV